MIATFDAMVVVVAILDSTQSFKTRGSIKSHQEAHHVFNSSAGFSFWVVFTNGRAGRAMVPSSCVRNALLGS